MPLLTLKTNPKVNEVFLNYPDPVRGKMQFLKELVIETAEETEGIDEMEFDVKVGRTQFCD